MAELTLTVQDHVALIEWSRPPANHFDRDLLVSIADAGEAAASDGARVIVLASQGRHFCAGADFSAGQIQADPAGAIGALYEAGKRIFALPVPVIAAVQGAAVGGGLGLACAADFRVATPRARFQANFARLGIHQGFATSLTLPRIVGQQHAASMLYGGHSVRGEEALRIGLVDRLAAEGAERDEALALAGEIAASAPLAVRSIRSTLRADLLAGLDDALAREVAEQARLMTTADAAAGIEASLAREVPTFTGR
ncbi:enoyl-CoA hydratase/isomerase family protein [Yimella sp. cx-51]|uniref:enoyl-CoA hydratase/isomerase family protein n=1 Tax=Yimella sp. cx-51 TaxID=2770551 RepID=UPI00165DCF4A|nr:enoyl-CoA hydratase/isomerase family protein [Yimella sp. cx-51]MBC9956266.1 enoyl-CoA hydratase/isomerase family protein [Yimella sp. cx-51]QTH38592.1 enoyl-CoA hydratase/isomerase family protein [Yimella sp. cx-51]